MEGKVWNDPLDRTFDDFVLGEVVLTRGRTVDIGDLTAFAGLTGDHYPLHTDEEYCKGTRFGTFRGPRRTLGVQTAHHRFTVECAATRAAAVGEAVTLLVDAGNAWALRP